MLAAPQNMHASIAKYPLLALPMFVILALQAIGVALFTTFITFRVMGSNYEAAALVAGQCGFGLGATPTAIANMQAVCERYGIDLFEVEYYDIADRPVGECRELLGVPPKSAGAIEGGSAGVFDVAGMSELQQRFAAQRRGVDP